MSRDDLKDIIIRVIDQLNDEDPAPQPGCILFGDNSCDMTTKYNINEEA